MHLLLFDNVFWPAFIWPAIAVAAFLKFFEVFTRIAVYNKRRRLMRENRIVSKYITPYKGSEKDGIKVGH